MGWESEGWKFPARFHFGSLRGLAGQAKTRASGLGRRPLNDSVLEMNARLFRRWREKGIQA